MIQRLNYMISESTNPCVNLAMEEQLLDTVQDGEATVYLWQNERTVVIGKNQNACAECNLTALREDGGHLVRRLSGGGAVYHDLGNLNFTFLSKAADENTGRNLEIIAGALRSFGLEPQKSGRNDLLLNGRKFSGNAFCTRKGNAYHHGTLMLNVDAERIERYLRVSSAKLEKHAVRSVRARVINLSELAPEITVGCLRTEIIAAAEMTYVLTAKKIETAQDSGFQRLVEKYGSDEWNLGEQSSLPLCRKGSFPWGQIEINYDIRDAICRNMIVYSDAMDAALPKNIAEQLVDCPWNEENIRRRLTAHAQTLEEETIALNILNLLFDAGEGLNRAGDVQKTG